MNYAELRPGGVLALDLSSMVGIAYGRLDDNAPQSGCWKLPLIGGEGMRYSAFRRSLVEAIDQLDPSALVLEAPLGLQALLRHSTLKVMEQQLALRGIAYGEAHTARIACTEVSADLVRFALLGQRRFAKGTVKREVMRYCRARGWRPPDHNAADACCVWAWHVGQLRGAPGVAGPLFRERAPALY